MIKPKLGYTLSEVLVAMAIIGVIAAIVIPQLAKNIEKNQTGAILGRTVEQIELGCQNAIQMANENSTDGSYFSTLGAITRHDLYPDIASSAPVAAKASFASDIAPFMGLVELSLTSDELSQVKSPIAYDNKSSVNIEKVYISNSKKYKSNKNQANVYIYGTTTTSRDAWKNDTDNVAYIYIDTNGLVKPNTFGRDLFRFTLNNSCKMIPYGVDTYKTLCADNKITTGRDCTARVVADGFKITY